MMKPMLGLFVLALVTLAGCQSGPEPQRQVQTPPLDQTLQDAVPNPNLSLYARAQTELKEGKFEAAVTLLESAIAADPRDVKALNDLCYAYVKLQQWNKAVKVGESALALDKQDPTVRFNLGRAYLGAKQYSDATTHLYLAYLKDARNLDVAWFLGLAYEGDNELLRAKEVYQKALTYAPGDSDFAAAAKRVESTLEAQKSMILRTDLTGDGQMSEIWTRQGELRVLAPTGKELLVFGGARARRFTSFEATVMDVGMARPILWVTARPGCADGHEHGLFAYDPATNQMKLLVWHGCATVVEFNKEKHSITFATRMYPSYVDTTYVFDGKELVKAGQRESLVPDFIWPGNVYIALTKILQQGYDEGFFLEKDLADAVLKTWGGKGTTATIQQLIETDRDLTGQITLKNGDREAKGTIHLVKVKGLWRIDTLEWK